MTQKSFKIRVATPSDVPTMVELDQLIFGGYGGDEDPAVIAARVKVFPAGCAIIEHESGTTAGYLTTEKWMAVRDPVLNEDPATTHQPHGTVLNITTFAIAPQFQNQRLGAWLLAYTERMAQAHGCREIVLETANARRFYERHGYSHIGERHQQGVNLHIMHRQLG